MTSWSMDNMFLYLNSSEQQHSNNHAIFENRHNALYNTHTHTLLILYRVLQKKLHEVYAPQFCNRTSQESHSFQQNVQK